MAMPAHNVLGRPNKYGVAVFSGITSGVKEMTIRKTVAITQARQRFRFLREESGVSLG